MKNKRYLIRIGLLGLLGISVILTIYIIHNVRFPRELIDTLDKIKGKENKIEFAKTLSLRKVIILGSQFVDEYGVDSLLGFMTEVLGPRWAADYSTIPETISIVVNEKLNPEWEEFLVSNFKRTDFISIYEDTDQILPFFLLYLENKTKDQKTKVVLIDIISYWFEGYKDNFTLSYREYHRTEKNFELANKQANLTIDFLNRIIQDKNIDKDVSNSAKVLYGKIRQIYLDENNVLPQEFKSLESSKQVKVKTEKVIPADLSEHLRTIETIMPKAEKVVIPLDKASVKKAIIKEGKQLVKTIKIWEEGYFSDSADFTAIEHHINTGNWHEHYTNKWEDIIKESGNILRDNKYFTTPPTLAASGEGKDAKFTATVIGSGEAGGVSVTINEKGDVTITGLE